MHDVTSADDEARVTAADGEVRGHAPRLVRTRYHSLARVEGPLVFVHAFGRASLGEMARVELPDGRVRLGQVLETQEDLAVLQLFGESEGIDTSGTSVELLGETAQADVSLDVLGRSFDGLGRPLDGARPVVAEARSDVNGLALNPYARDEPNQFIETGISAIDGLNTLVRGQKLPIFSAFGLPGSELMLQIATQARVRGGEPFAVVFAAIGITSREEAFFRAAFESAESRARTVLFLNRASDPTLERLITPRYALTVAEHLAFRHGMHVLVLLTDMTAYCEALRELGAVRQEVPGRRGYPGYMYTDLASIYERAGRIRGRPGSITQIPLLSLPDDDITHPIPDLTGYITEGQIVLSRELHRQGVAPPIDVLPSLSRLMNKGIGQDKTREDHRDLADQLYAAYARGRDLRRQQAILGEAALTPIDKQYLALAEKFERTYVGQESARRTIEETLSSGWQVLAGLPVSELKRVHPEFVERYFTTPSPFPPPSGGRLGEGRPLGQERTE